MQLELREEPPGQLHWGQKSQLQLLGLVLQLLLLVQERQQLQGRRLQLLLGQLRRQQG